jgi:hypothetical protein
MPLPEKLSADARGPKTISISELRKGGDHSKQAAHSAPALCSPRQVLPLACETAACETETTAAEYIFRQYEPLKRLRQCIEFFLSGHLADATTGDLHEYSVHQCDLQVHWGVHLREDATDPRVSGACYLAGNILSQKRRSDFVACTAPAGHPGGYYYGKVHSRTHTSLATRTPHLTSPHLRIRTHTSRACTPRRQVLLCFSMWAKLSRGQHRGDRVRYEFAYVQWLEDADPDRFEGLDAAEVEAEAKDPSRTRLVYSDFPAVSGAMRTMSGKAFYDIVPISRAGWPEKEKPLPDDAVVVHHRVHVLPGWRHLQTCKQAGEPPSRFYINFDTWL